MSAICVFTNNMTKNISGNVIFTETKRGLQIKINISGISPGKHGFHIHEYGDLSEGCGSLCSHYNPTNSVHGSRNSEERHLGDLGNITSKSGVSQGTLTTNKITLNKSIRNIIGRMIIVHADRDDLGKGDDCESLKTGNAGKRLACGVIGIRSD